MKLDLVVIDSLGKRWLGDPEIRIRSKYLKAEMTESLLGCTDDRGLVQLLMMQHCRLLWYLDR